MELINFVMNFFVTDGIYFVHAMLCWSPDQLLSLHRSAAASGVKISWGSADQLPVLRTKRPEGIVLDMDCPGAKGLLENASMSRLYVTIRYSWLLVHDEMYNDTRLEEFLDSVSLLPDTQFVYSSLDTNLEIYRAKYNTPLVKIDLGINRSATSRQMAVLQNSRRLTHHRKSLNVSLTAGVVIEQPSQFMGWNDLSNVQVDTFAKFTYPLLMYLAEDLNISYNIFQVDIYGAIGNDSQWSGLCGLFQRRRIELGIASIMMRADRLDLLDYATDTVVMKSSFMFRQPAQSTVSNMFLLPFSRGVWAGVCVAFVASSLFLALGSRPLRSMHPTLNLLTPLETFTFTIGVICQQGTFLNPRPQSVRLVMLVSLVTSVFAFTSYSAKIVAILQTPSSAMKTLEDLTASPIACGVQETTYKTRYYTESTDPVIQKFYKRKVQPQGDKAFMSVVDGIAKMRRQFFAFQVEVEAGYQVIRKTFTEEEKCGVTEVDALSLPRVGIPLRKHSGYKNLFAVRLRWHREIGLFARSRAIWMPRKPRCEVRGTGFVSPGLRDLLPAIKVLLYGTAVAVVILIMEIGWYKVKQRQISRKQVSKSNIEDDDVRNVNTLLKKATATLGRRRQP